jgi:hypothetical protein
MISELIPVFLNGHTCRVTPGATLGQLLAQDDPALARALALGTAKATDGRGIAAAADLILVPGAIFRVVHSARPEGAADA